ncbi:hypothetical protein AWB78_07737 [Caballeronia calidae]|uniref:Uncharacterized protein n=1 Tax=Caballeronia calidae TaxID=1777139 RepID=A0A158EGL8_9BURK|nr:hypothetical protein [Caballeronia calidae]SAL05850.1 hypothetical protein AWB78_07737 [Caballeronia calidae]
MFIFTRNTTPCRPELTDEAAYLIRIMLADLYHWIDREYGKQARRAIVVLESRSQKSARVWIRL